MAAYRVVSQSCSWCHELNPVGRIYCRHCGHQAQVPRMECQCPRCQQERRVAVVRRYAL